MWVETGKIGVGYGRRLTNFMYRAADPQTVDGHLNSLQQQHCQTRSTAMLSLQK